MQVTETLNEGLKREIKIIVPQADLQAKLTDKLHEAKGRVRLNGFRPGKVPVQHLRKMYGKSYMAEVVNEILQESPRSILAERGEKSATQPEVDMTEDESEAEKVLTGDSDFEFSLKYEVIPPIELKDFSSISITRPVVDIPQAQIEEQLVNVARSAAEYTEKDGKAEDGDRVTINYLGKVDDVAFDGGAADDAQLVLGSGTFIPGFEDQLIGSTAGDETKVTVTFPDDYQAEHLAGKEAVFDVTVTLVEQAEPIEINDETASKLGIESAERLREVVREQMESQYGGMTRLKIKRQLLDALDEMYKIDTPAKLVETEFNNIWSQVNAELEQAGRSFDDEETTEDEAREEYRRLAERRVRLGLVLSQIGEDAGVQVTEAELQQSLMNHVRQYRGQEKEVFEFFRNNPDAIANLRAPIFEEKTVDHLLTVVSVTDQTVTAEELMADDDEDELALSGSKQNKVATDKDGAGETATEAVAEDDAGEATPDHAGKAE